MKETSKKLYEAILAYLDRHPVQGRMLVFALSAGFVIVALGVAINLASTESIIKVLNLLR